MRNVAHSPQNKASRKLNVLKSIIPRSPGLIISVVLDVWAILPRRLSYAPTTGKIIQLKSQNLKEIKNWLPRFEYHIYRDRLRQYGMPTTPHRVAFMYWAEEIMNHCFTFEDFVNEWSNGNDHREINRWVDSRVISTEYFEGKFYYVTSYIVGGVSPFYCPTCNRINIKKLLSIKEQCPHD